jgi:hypothetical protein
MDVAKHSASAVIADNPLFRWLPVPFWNWPVPKRYQSADEPLFAV